MGISGCIEDFMIRKNKEDLIMNTNFCCQIIGKYLCLKIDFFLCFFMQRLSFIYFISTSLFNILNKNSSSFFNGILL